MALRFSIELAETRVTVKSRRATWAARAKPPRRPVCCPARRGSRHCRAARPRRRSAGLRRLRGRGDRGKGLVIDGDELGRVLRRGEALRDDRGDRIADPAHAVLREERRRRLEIGPPVAPLPPHARVKVPSPSAVASAPVRTARTPGSASALVLSMARILAAAWGERST